LKEIELLPEAFLEAGGRISLSEWAELSDEERLALADAGAKLRIAEADLVVRALVAAVTEALASQDLKGLAKKAMREAVR